MTTYSLNSLASIPLKSSLTTMVVYQVNKRFEFNDVLSIEI